MESANLFSSSSSSLIYHPFSKTLRSSRTRVFTVAARSRKAHDASYSSCSGGGGGGGGRLVDVNMIVLRKRIHEMKMVERNYEPPSDWMEWEKQCFTSYDGLICDLVGVLQSQMMNTRPSLVLAMVALVSLSVPFSTAVVFSHFVEVTQMIFCGIHSCY
ncbi:uncharacterized protein LOC126674424 [Mercurialis annua]|uniref:uncharacterized protein LOC126674424 n=1 Tax=Mercurialis annua TaxID=3986 RepID=UPI002160BE9B|nr:uncharacterized protein LOC126674424 [Mercurialis annua]